jgi:hypothetical protein
MKKLLGVNDLLSQNQKRSNIKHCLSPSSPPPLPAEFKISPFVASRKNEFEEQEKIRNEQLERLIKSK